MPEDKALALPGSSWETVKKIILAFYAASNEEDAKLETIANYANVQRPVVSMNNNFLRSVGIVRADQWKLTDKGLRYATALRMANTSMAQETLADIAKGNPILNQLVRLLLARGEMNVDTFKAEAMLRLIIAPNDRQAQFVRPLLDMLQDAALIRIEGDTVCLGNTHGLTEKESPPPKPPNLRDLFPPTPPPAQEDGLPILLGPNRIVYLQLPEDWDGKKDLPKLLKLLEISLGEEA